MRENGFFRVELLVFMFAVVLVMVFAVPKAKSAFVNIKKNSAIDSVISYKENIDNFYVSKLVLNNDFKLDGIYNISNGNLIINGEEYNIDVYGNVPSDGYLLYKDNILKIGCVTVNGFSVNVSDGKVVSAVEGNCSGEYISNSDVAVVF